MGPIDLYGWNHESTGVFAQIAIPRDWIHSIEDERSELEAVRYGLGPAECDEPIGLLLRVHWCHLREPCSGSD